MDLHQTIASEINCQKSQVDAAVGLLDEGSTVPFIARYRKEATGGLDDTQLRNLEERLRYLRELEERREAIIKSIEEQGKLTPELRADILAADTKTRLEDLYLPYKKKRRTKGQIAIEAGLEPLADKLYGDPNLDPVSTAQGFVDAEKGVADSDAALEGARYVLMERFAEDADLLADLREYVQKDGQVSSKLVKGKESEGAKFRDYFEFSEPLSKIPSHRVLALLRGRSEGFLRVAVVVDEDPDRPRQQLSRPESKVARRFEISENGRAADAWLQNVVRSTWRVKIQPHLETDMLVQIREAAEEEAIRIFADNLKDLLLAAPGGPKATIGLDPGLRTGVKVAVVDRTGKLVDHTTIFPHAPRNLWDESIDALAKIAKKHSTELISIGNGTASRETDKLARELIKKHPELGLEKLVVSESGASVYSASQLAADEFPDLDVSFRGAASIARRLQDPLAELVKIEPKSIGVGQYQHDVNQSQLARSLDAVVEDCVNAVGVDVNTASSPLLERVAGLTRTLAMNIVKHRDTNGPFSDRQSLLSVPRMGDKTFEQAAGFLRVMNGQNPLDASSVHPEAYPVVQRICSKSNREVANLIGDSSFLRSLSAEEFTDETFGLPTVTDIIQELEKPGRDPRPDFVTAEFQEGVETLQDLESGMTLEGVVSNVTAFGAFVDVGVHQDGLVHISQLSWDYVNDPREVVKAGDVVRVQVMEVDIARKRIGLTMRLGEAPQKSGNGGRTGKPGGAANSGQTAGAKRDQGSRGAKQRDSGSRQKSGKPSSKRGKSDRSTSRNAGGGNNVFAKLLDQAVADAKKKEKA